MELIALHVPSDGSVKNIGTFIIYSLWQLSVRLLSSLPYLTGGTRKRNWRRLTFVEVSDDGEL